MYHLNLQVVEDLQQNNFLYNTYMKNTNFTETYGPNLTYLWTSVDISDVHFIFIGIQK